MMRSRQMSRHQAATAIQARIRGRQARSEARVGKLRPGFAAAVAAATKHQEQDGLLDAEPETLDRERICCDILNTSVMGALVGGFALNNMYTIGSEPLDYMIYLTSCLAVHACTCSCLTSALLYRVCVRMPDERAPAWARRYRFLLSLPLAKFGMGCVSYLASVILISYRDLESSTAVQSIALAIGLASMLTVFVTVFMISRMGDGREPRRHSQAPRGRVVPDAAPSNDGEWQFTNGRWIRR